jgi:hydroxymethylpyrimidine kinase/phosphomethylpyrimidine kinase/thiamine-phosphate diphosphorylase
MSAMHDLNPAPPPPRPIIWSIAGNDSGGGAGLSADQRAAQAAGVHLCPVIACVTAQCSTAVTQIEPVSPALLNAQLNALWQDMPPDAVKVGLLGSVALVEVVARWIDRLRERQPDLPLVVDPVLRASSGGSFTRDGLTQAYRELLLPRTSVLTPNRREALALLSSSASVPPLTEPDTASVPLLAERLRALGVQAVCITGGDAGAIDTALALDWLDTPHAQGWLALPRLAAPHNHGTGCTHATFIAAALARGFVAADAAVLAKMGTTAALRAGYAAGAGAGPVQADASFSSDPSLLPRLSCSADPAELQQLADSFAPSRPSRLRPGLYTLVDRAEQAPAVLAAGGTDLGALQLRFKRDAHRGLDDTAFAQRVRAEIQATLAATRAAGVPLYVNDHWQAAADQGADGVHLGQEDLLALGSDGRATLRAAQQNGLALGLSSHSLWELCRAAALQPDYIACGPVWPTTTKDMPWHPQGLDNLSWWAWMAPTPVVAIGGLLTPDQTRQVARASATSACLVRAVQADPQGRMPAFRAAWALGRSEPAFTPPAWPHSSLARTGH